MTIPSLIARIELADEIVLSVDIYSEPADPSTGIPDSLTPGDWRVYVSGQEVATSEWLTDQIETGLRGELWERCQQQWEEFEADCVECRADFDTSEVYS